MQAHEVSSLRTRLSKRLQELGVEEKPWPGRTDGFASLLFEGKEFAHFHADSEIDIHLGKQVIQREGLVHPVDSRVHPHRAKGSSWYEMKVTSAAQVDEALRLVGIAIQALHKRSKK